MRLEVESIFPKTYCPYCHAPLVVETTYEDNLLECEGVVKCPLCEEEIVIDNKLVFSASKVKHGKNKLDRSS